MVISPPNINASSSATFGRNPTFAAIVRALAAHPLGLVREELARQAKTALGGRLSEHFRDLESAGFMSADTPFHRGPDSRQIKYFLCDAYLRFYFTFIYPNLKKIRAGQGTNILAGLSGSGALGHFCREGPPPHDLLVCILPNDNAAPLYERLRAKTRR